MSVPLQVGASEKRRNSTLCMYAGAGRCIVVTVYYANECGIFVCIHKQTRVR